ncbi:MAG: fumarylacetoacetate hydrolase family protein [Bacilli bacterium]
MKLLTYRSQDGLRLGIKTDRGVLDVRAAKQRAQSADAPEHMEEVIQGGAEALSALETLLARAVGAGDDLWLSEERLRLGPCVPDPGKIICIGTNYRKHAMESNMPIPATPILFSKFNNTVAAHGDVIALPFNSDQVDYEAELAVIIGSVAKRVPAQRSLRHVFGYCNVNDISARDLQFKTHQWLLGKSCDGFSPLGPYLVTADEVGDPNALRITCHVNGERRQNSTTADMIFPCNEIVSYVSEHMTLYPGDIILTGTPEGVMLGYPPEKRVWLKEGDEVTVEVEKLGRLTNRFRREA